MPQQLLDKSDDDLVAAETFAEPGDRSGPATPHAIDAKALRSAAVTPPDGGSPMTMQLVLLLVFATFSLSDTIWSNEIIFRTCTVRFGFERDECERLGTANASKPIETLVQPYAANILMVRQLCESIVPAVLCLFMGPWSDRFGRRPILISSIGGFLLSSLTSTLVASWSAWRAVCPWAYALAFVPASLGGCFATLLTASLCYVSDLSTVQNRAYRLAVMQLMIFVGVLLGNQASSWLYEHLASTAMVFAIASGMLLIALAIVVLSVEESVRDDPADRRLSRMIKFSALFNVQLVFVMVATCFRPREHYERPIIVMTLLALSTGVFVLTGTDTVVYLYYREMFAWTVEQCNTLSSAEILVQVIGTFFSMLVLVRCFGVPESIMAVVAFVSFAGRHAMSAIAVEPWHLYASLIIGAFGFVANPMCRSILAEAVPANDIGSVFALTSCLESLTGLISAPLYSFVYARTLAFYPGAFFMIGSGAYALCACLMVLVTVVRSFRTPAVVRPSYGPIGV